MMGRPRGYYVPEHAGAYVGRSRRYAPDMWPIVRVRDGFHVTSFVNREAAVAIAAKMTDEEATEC